MAEVIIMPKLGFNMDEGQLVKWLKSEGDPVSKGEVLFEVNTDKTTMPVEATTDGVLLKTLLAEGDFAPVFTPIAVVGSAGEDSEAALTAFAGSNVQGETAAAQSAPENPSPLSPAKEPAPPAADLKLTPKARRLVVVEGLDPASLREIPGTGFRGGLTARDIKASPLARRLAEREGINLADIPGSGAGGKILRTDVEAALSPAPGADTGEKQILRSTPYKGVRKIIGDRLAQSKFTAPHLYFTESVDSTALTAFRASLNGMAGAAAGQTPPLKIAVSDLLVMAVSKALTQVPEINVSLVGEEVVCYRSTNIGVAVAGENGLVVPVIREVQGKTLSVVSAESRDLVARAKAGRLAPEEYTGGTFTISNLGMFGIENFTAILNPPESAILAVGSVRKKAVVITGENGEDTLAIRPMMNVTLSVDHRLIDGLPAARFLGCLKGLLENPLRILL